MEKVLFIFRRDLRLEDNTGLNFALKNAKKVIPCFIFTPEQIEQNPYRSNRCLQFMIESLEDLESSLKKNNGRLYLFNGSPTSIIEKSIKELKIDGVIVNRDYTPYSIKRDQEIESLCNKYEIKFFSFDDALLNAPEDTLKSDGNPYTIFTPFFKRASQFEIRSVSQKQKGNFKNGSISFAEQKQIYNKILPKRISQAKGGRSEALKILEHLDQFSKYSNERDFPALDATTHLSPHLKFTTCSPREIYYAISNSLGKSSELIRSLYWRDFFYSITFNFPHVFGHPFHKKYENLSWNYDKNQFKIWCEGKTGFPIVDAGMRELAQTGFMHNRVRMIVGSFLVKDMHIDWQWGEKYFAQSLIDYDPAVNNGNWQWVASTGCDSQPYFRIFNPWLQQKKFDSHCLYIKKWVEELKDIPSEVIHKWYNKENWKKATQYPPPILTHEIEAKKTLSLYKKVR